jgi:predicted nucleic acid-binding protein
VNLSAKRILYWDACVFIGLLNQEKGRIDETLKVWREAERGETEIWTSALTLVEVFKVKCDGATNALDPSLDLPVAEMFDQPWVFKVTLDPSIAREARRLLRSYPKCKKPTDAVHLATASAYSVHELHTWDGNDLIALDGMVPRKGGGELRICTPYEAIQSAVASDPAQQGLFES